MEKRENILHGQPAAPARTEVQGNEIQDRLAAALEGLPDDKKNAVMQTVTYAVERERTFSGPLPAPEDFAAYERVLPGATERILAMAERQADHRIKAENRIVDGSFRQSGRGQIIGAVLASFFGAVALALGLTGHDSAAIAIGVTTVLGLISAFVLNKSPFQETKPAKQPD